VQIIFYFVGDPGIEVKVGLLPGGMAGHPPELLGNVPHTLDNQNNQKQTDRQTPQRLRIHLSAVAAGGWKGVDLAYRVNGELVPLQGEHEDTRDGLGAHTLEAGELCLDGLRIHGPDILQAWLPCQTHDPHSSSH